MLGYLKKGFNIVIISLILILLSNIILNLSLDYKYKNNFSNSYTQSVIIDDITIHYYQEGVGTPLLIINDIFNTINDHSYFSSKLNSNIISINFVELLNKLTSEHSDEFLSSLLFKFMNELGYDKFNILAFSSSSKIALSMANFNNNKVDKLILVNPKEYASKTFLLDNYAYQKFLYTKNYWNSSLINKNEFEYNYFLLKNINKKILNTYLYFLNNLTYELEDIKNDILTISNIQNLKYSNYLSNKIPSNSLIEIMNCGEFPYIEANDIFTKEINLFLG